jgi:hypothetical protein
MPCLGSAIKNDTSVLNIDITIIDGSTVLPQMVGEEAICFLEELIVFAIALSLGNSHHPHITGSHIFEATLTVIEVDICVDLINGGSKVNINELCGIAVGNVPGEHHTAVPEGLVPTNTVEFPF